MVLTTDLDQLGNNILVIIIILGIFIIGFIYKAIVDKMFQNSLSQSKLGLSSGIENKDGKDVCYLYVSNKSFSSVIIESFGFKNSLKETDFIKKYKADNKINENQKVFVPSRDTIKLEVEFDTLYDLFKGYKIDKIEAYTFSSLGNKNTKAAKTIRKQIALIAKPIYKEIHKNEILEKKEQKKKEKSNKKTDDINTSCDEEIKNNSSSEENFNDNIMNEFVNENEVNDEKNDIIDEVVENESSSSDDKENLE